MVAETDVTELKEQQTRKTLLWAEFVVVMSIMAPTLIAGFGNAGTATVIPSIEMLSTKKFSRAVM